MVLTMQCSSVDEETEIGLDEALPLQPETLEAVLAAIVRDNFTWYRESVAEERDADKGEQRSAG